jgi:large subunit ribosomal protein L29
MKATEQLKELRGLPKEDLRKKIQEDSKELMSLRFQNSSGQLKQTSQLKEIKKRIARAMTVLNQIGQ